MDRHKETKTQALNYVGISKRFIRKSAVMNGCEILIGKRVTRRRQFTKHFYYVLNRELLLQFTVTCRLLDCKHK